MRFEYDGKPWSLQVRLPVWEYDFGGIGSALPDGALCLVNANSGPQQQFRFWSYTEQQGDFNLTVPFPSVALEPGSIYPAGKLHTLGNPVVVNHGGHIKVFVKLWGNGKPSALARVATNIWLR